MRGSLGRAQHACIQMLRGLFVLDVEVRAGLLLTIFRNHDVVVLGGHHALYVVTRNLD